MVSQAIVPDRATPPVPDASALSIKVVLELATAPDVRSGMARAVGLLVRDGGAERVEWWGPAEDGTPRCLQAAGARSGGRPATFPVGPAGTVVVVSHRWGPSLTEAMARLSPVLRRRWTEEQLARSVGGLLRCNEALEEFTALVAHELKAQLHAALLLEDPSEGVRRALDLIDALLEATRAECTAGTCASPAECLDEVLRDLGPIAAEVVADLPGELPLPSTALRVVLRNLVANAAAASARHVHIGVATTGGSWALTVSDDGEGIGEPDRYVVGSRLGLSLCRRIARRFGATLDLAPGAAGGTCATLVLESTRP